MGSIQLITANSIDLNGTLPQGTKIRLEYINLGDNVQDSAWIEPWSNSATPVQTAVVDRKTVLEMQFWLEGTTVAKIIADAEAVRNEFRASNVISWSPDYPAVAVQGIQTYKSAVAPFLKTDDDLRRLTSQLLVLDWNLQITRTPYYSAKTAPPVG